MGGGTDIAFQIWNRGIFENKLFTCFLNPGGDVGVAIFFIITGYFQVYKKEISLSKIITETFFYSLVLLVISLILQRHGIQIIGNNSEEIITYIGRSLFIPVSGSIWWFISAYFFVILLSPFTNRSILRLNEKGRLVVASIAWLFCYCFPSIFRAPFAGIQTGVFFYIIGATIRLNNKKKNALGDVIAFISLWTIGAVCFFILYSSHGNNAGSHMILLGQAANAFVTASVVPICAMSAFKIATNVNLGSNKIINFISATTFGVYLIHDSALGENLLWDKIINPAETQFFMKLFPLYAVLTILAVFIVCSLIDTVRIFLIEPTILTKIKVLEDRMSEKFFRLTANCRNKQEE